MTNNSELPHVDIHLDDYKHPYFDEWHYGEDRGTWTGGRPVTAQPAFIDAGKLFPTVVDVNRLRLERDQLPEFIAWLTAVYHATSEAARS